MLTLFVIFLKRPAQEGSGRAYLAAEKRSEAMKCAIGPNASSIWICEYAQGDSVRSSPA